MQYLRPVFAIEHTLVGVKAVTTEVLPAAEARVYVLLVNDSDSDMFIKINGEVAKVNEGIRLNANGGSYEMSIPYGNISGAQINGCHVGGHEGTKTMLVTEGHNRDINK